MLVQQTNWSWSRGLTKLGKIEVREFLLQFVASKLLFQSSDSGLFGGVEESRLKVDSA